MNNDITKYVADWFTRAEDDLAAARILLEKGLSFNPVCFHAQQAAEKYLKGFLAHHEKHIRKIHDLEILVEECQHIVDSFGSLQNEAILLTQIYPKSRYPDDFVEFRLEDAEKALEAALCIKRFVLSKIKPQETNRGFSILAILAAVAGLLVVAVGGYLFSVKYVGEKGTPSQTSSESESVSGGNVSHKSDTIAIDTSNWKTYRNEKYGFEVRYPSGWEVLNNHPNDPIRFNFSFRDVKYGGSFEWPGFNIQNFKFNESEMENWSIHATRIFSKESAVDELIAIYFDTERQRIYATCALYLDPAVITVCNQILSTFKLIE